jgi:hypothetical protein
VIYHRFHLGQFCDSKGGGGVEKGGNKRNRWESAAYQRIVKVARGERYEPGVRFLIYGMRDRAIPLLCGRGCALGHSGGLARGSFQRRHEKK